MGWNWAGTCLPQLPPTSVQLLGQAEQVQATRAASEGPGSTTLTLTAAWVPRGGWGEAAGIQMLPTRPLRDKGLSLLLLLPLQQTPPPLPSPSSEALWAQPAAASHSLSLLPSTGKSTAGPSGKNVLIDMYIPQCCNFVCSNCVNTRMDFIIHTYKSIKAYF